MTQDNFERFMLIPADAAQIYVPGRYMIFTKDADDLTEGYSPDDISVRLVSPPGLSENMQRIWDMRYARRFPDGVRRNGKFPGMLRPSLVEGKLGLDLFESCYLDWNLTLPQGDEFDSQLELECMRTCFNIHHVPITVDGQLIYVSRSKTRASWHDKILFTHAFGDDFDKDYSCGEVLRKLEQGQGAEFFRQARDGMLREINPFEENWDLNVKNKVLRELLKPEDIDVYSATCLTLSACGKDLGYHLCFAADVRKEAGDLLAERKKYPMGGRIADYHSVRFDEDSMVAFFRDNDGRIALTIEPALIMVCVQKFGEDFLDKLPFGVIRQRTRRTG